MSETANPLAVPPPGTAADEPAEKDERWSSREILESAIAFAALVLAWEFGVRVLGVSQLVVPTPSAIIDAIRALFMSGQIYPHLAITLTEILAGFVLGAVAALALGCLISQFRIVDRLVYPYIVAFQAVPKVAIAPLLVIWFGFGMSSKVVMTAIIAFFPILVNTTAGLKTVEQDRIDLMIALKATRWQIFRYVRLPTALPFIFAGLDVGAVLAVIGAIVGEFVGASGGLGYLLLVYEADLKIAYVFAILVVLALIGILLHAAVQFAQKRVVFWVNVGNDRPMGV